jgi:hypothetical protein
MITLLPGTRTVPKGVADVMMYGVIEVRYSFKKQLHSFFRKVAFDLFNLN